MPVSQPNTLSQQRTWYGVNHFSLTDERVLKVRQASKRKSLSYMIDIISLDSDSQRVISIAWGWLVAAIIFSLSTFTLIKFPGLLESFESYYSVSMLVLSIIFALASFIFFWIFSTRKQVFYSRHGRIPLLEIWVNQPTKQSFRQFKNLLTTSIQQVQDKAALNLEQQLTGEMKMLRRLVDENVVDREVYESAKTKLLEKF